MSISLVRWKNTPISSFTEYKGINPNKLRKPQVFFATEVQRVTIKPEDKHITQHDADNNIVKTDDDDLQIKKGKDQNSFKDDDDDEDEQPKVILTRRKSKITHKHNLSEIEERLMIPRRTPTTSANLCLIGMCKYYCYWWSHI